MIEIFNSDRSAARARRADQEMAAAASMTDPVARAAHFELAARLMDATRDHRPTRSTYRF